METECFYKWGKQGIRIKKMKLNDRKKRKGQTRDMGNKEHDISNRLEGKLLKMIDQQNSSQRMIGSNSHIKLGLVKDRDIRVEEDHSVMILVTARST